MSESVLLVKCSDKPGLIAHISGFLHEHKNNIISLSEHVDKDSSTFFMRLEFSGELSPEGLERIRAGLPEHAQAWLKGNNKKRLLLFATKESHCLGDILLQAQYGDLNAEICGVIANHNDLADLSKTFQVPFYFVSHEGKSIEKHESEIHAIIQQNKADLLVFAKYMRIVSPAFVARYQNRIINIHHSFLPAFAGARPYHQAHERGVKVIGATAHFVTETLDDGPIILQNVTYVDHSHSVNALKSAGRSIEQTTLTAGLRLVLEERVFVNGRKTVVFH